MSSRALFWFCVLSLWRYCFVLPRRRDGRRRDLRRLTVRSRCSGRLLLSFLHAVVIAILFSQAPAETLAASLAGGASLPARLCCSSESKVFPLPTSYDTPPWTSLRSSGYLRGTNPGAWPAQLVSAAALPSAEGRGLFPSSPAQPAGSILATHHAPRSSTPARPAAAGVARDDEPSPSQSETLDCGLSTTPSVVIFTH